MIAWEVMSATKTFSVHSTFMSIDVHVEGVFQTHISNSTYIVLYYCPTHVVLCSVYYVTNSTFFYIFEYGVIYGSRVYGCLERIARSSLHCVFYAAHLFIVSVICALVF